MLSVIILTKNEEDRIKVCLESVKWADEIIVLDNGSTDQTLEIVERYTDKLIEFGTFSAYAISRKNVIFGQEVSDGPYKHDWVIRLIKKSDLETWVGKIH